MSPHIGGSRPESTSCAAHRVTHRSGFGAVIVALGAVLLPAPISAQVDIGGYALGVGSYAGESDFLPAGSSWLGRGRLMADYAAGWITVETAYEHLTQRQPLGGGFGFTNPGGGTSTDWLPLDWTIHESEQNEWRHRFDRVAIRAEKGPIDVTVGRQAISWATTLFLTPADPFAPFNPSDPFREYRGGVDAVRVRAFTGPFTEIEAVVRPTDTPSGTTMTALGRIGTSKGGWAFGGWAGLLHDEAAAAVFATGGLGSTSIRSEIALREGLDGSAALRAALGFDHFFQPLGKDLYVLGEIQYDEYGASDASELIDVARSAPFNRGDMQVLGRWAIATQASYQIHPLIGVSALVLLNPEDASTLFAPGLSWSATSYASVRAGTYFGFGHTAPTSFELGSEYGSVPGLGYLSVSMFF